MANPHDFKKSQAKELEGVYFHNLFYSSLVKDSDYNLSLDRFSCNYETEEGKKYQRQDTDVILHLRNNKTLKEASLNVSEKYRKFKKRFKNIDLLLETVSVYNPNKEIKEKDLGWSIKDSSDIEYKPNRLSYIVNQEDSKVVNCYLIKEYELLKDYLKNELNLKEILKNELFINEVNKKIKWMNDNNYKGGNLKINENNILKNLINNENDFLVCSSLVIAKNKSYYTLSLTFDLNEKMINKFKITTKEIIK